MSKNKEEYETILENTPDEYLAVVFKFADWIDTSYKKLATQYKENPKAVRELYLCACDKVPIELLAIAQKKEPFEDSFRLIRKRYMESFIQNEYLQMAEEMSAMHKEVTSMSGTVNDIANTIPYLEELFVDSKPQNSIGKDVEEILKQTISANKEKDVLILKGQSEDVEEKDDSKTGFGEIFIKAKKKISEILFENQVSPVSYIQKMTEKGFSTEQITFILDCIDTGMHKRELDNIAISPSLSIEMMEKLKKMQLEKRKGDLKNGK